LVERIRCFVSVDVEDASVLASIARVQQTLLSIGGGLKLVERENLHLTLRFLGELPKGLVDEISQRLNRVEFEAFEIELKGLGAFPSSSRPRVVWIGVERGAEELEELAREVNKALSGLGIPPPDKEFCPHLTIARVKSRSAAAAVSRILAEHGDLSFGKILVDNFRLKKSVLTPRGPIYSTLMEKRARDVGRGESRGDTRESGQGGYP